MLEYRNQNEPLCSIAFQYILNAKINNTVGSKTIRADDCQFTNFLLLFSQILMQSRRGCGNIIVKSSEDNNLCKNLGMKTL